MNPFSRSGFDTLIGPNSALYGNLHIAPGTTAIIDGHLSGEFIGVPGSGDTKQDKSKTTLVLNGSAALDGTVEVNNVTISGTLRCDMLIVSGCLALKKGASVHARVVKYREIVIQNGAVIMSRMEHLDQEVPAPALQIESAVKEL